MRHDCRAACASRDPDRLDGLGERADLVELDQDGVGAAALHALADQDRVGDEDVVADHLQALTEPLNGCGRFDGRQHGQFRTLVLE
jgi:hypothetical protein